MDEQSEKFNEDLENIKNHQTAEEYNNWRKKILQKESTVD